MMAENEISGVQGAPFDMFVSVFVLAITIASIVPEWLDSVMVLAQGSPATAIAGPSIPGNTRDQAVFAVVAA